MAPCMLTVLIGIRYSTLRRHNTSIDFAFSTSVYREILTSNIFSRERFAPRARSGLQGLSGRSMAVYQKLV